MQEWIEGLHWGLAILFFWAVGILRTSIVYALGRGAAAEDGACTGSARRCARPCTAGPRPS
ncbi:Uncharacterised protein [Rothia kristinae]|nr:Uncharacterised protein [Rothia kristinae]